MTAFTWKVCREGYRWESAEDGSQGDPVLVPLKPWPAREYEPLTARTGLFRDFADLKADPDEFLRFANEYGTLFPLPVAGGDRPKSLVADKSIPALTSEKGHIPSAEGPVETLAHWKAATELVRSAVALWDTIRAKKDDPADLGFIAEAIVLGCQGRVEPHFAFDRKSGRCAWSLAPTDLLAAIWLQFADAVTGDRQYHRCPGPGCGKWYELSPAAKGPARNYCSDACKQRAYRNRKKDRALELFKNRRTVEEIAKELKVTVKTVQQWLADAPQDDEGNTTEGRAPYDRLGIDL